MRKRQEINPAFRFLIHFLSGGTPMPKFISVQEAAHLVKDGMTVMIGGFLGCGNAHHIIDVMVEKGVTWEEITQELSQR